MITPVVYINDEDLGMEEEELGVEIVGNRTYPMNFKTLRFESGTVDGALAIKQFIIKTLLTERYHYMIYSDYYGSELEDLIGTGYNLEHLKQEIESKVKDALVYDDRISEVKGVSVERDADKAYIKVTVETVDDGPVEQDIEVNI